MNESLISDICDTCGYDKKYANRQNKDSFLMGLILGITTTSIVITLGICFQNSF